MPKQDSTVTIYGLASSKDGEIRYVGQTKQTLGKRLIHHMHNAITRNDKCHRGAWIRHVVATGYEVKIFEIEQNAERSSAERRWIAFYKQQGVDLVNATEGGDCGPVMLGNKFGRANKGRKFTEEHKRKMSLALIGNKRGAGRDAWNKGGTVSAEVRKKISESLKGHPGIPMSPEHKAKLLAIHIGRKASDETKRKLGESRLGSKNGFAVLDEAKVMAIRDCLMRKETQKEIAKKFSVSQQTVSSIKQGRGWSHIR